MLHQGHYLRDEEHFRIRRLAVWPFYNRLVRKLHPMDAIALHELRFLPDFDDFLELSTIRPFWTDSWASISKDTWADAQYHLACELEEWCNDKRIAFIRAIEMAHGASETDLSVNPDDYTLDKYNDIWFLRKSARLRIASHLSGSATSYYTVPEFFGRVSLSLDTMPRMFSRGGRYGRWYRMLHELMSEEQVYVYRAALRAVKWRVEAKQEDLDKLGKRFVWVNHPTASQRTRKRTMSEMVSSTCGQRTAAPDWMLLRCVHALLLAAAPFGIFFRANPTARTAGVDATCQRLVFGTTCLRRTTADCRLSPRHRVERSSTSTITTMRKASIRDQSTRARKRWTCRMAQRRLGHVDE